MSQNSSPGRSTPGSFDPFYDSTFTAEITSKMRVPDKICVIEGSEPPDLILSQHSEIKSKMNVPERIIVAGDNKHIAVRESVPELKFDTPFPMNLPNLILAPPPNVLTVDEYPYPSVDIKSERSETKRTQAIDKELMSMNDPHETSMNTSANPDDEVTKLRVQLRHLSRRVLDIEQENQQRQNREMLFYVIGVSYFIIQSILWLHRRL